MGDAVFPFTRKGVLGLIVLSIIVNDLMCCTWTPTDATLINVVLLFDTTQRNLVSANLFNSERDIQQLVVLYRFTENQFTAARAFAAA